MFFSITIFFLHIICIRSKKIIILDIISWNLYFLHFFLLLLSFIFFIFFFIIIRFLFNIILFAQEILFTCDFDFILFLLNLFQPVSGIKLFFPGCETFNSDWSKGSKFGFFEHFLFLFHIHFFILDVGLALD